LESGTKTLKSALFFVFRTTFWRFSSLLWEIFVKIFQAKSFSTVSLCGCPGLLALCWGSLSAVVSFVPGADINIGGSSDPGSALFAGLGTLCVGILFIAIPVGVGFYTLRKKLEAATPDMQNPTA